MIHLTRPDMPEPLAPLAVAHVSTRAEQPAHPKLNVRFERPSAALRPWIQCLWQVEISNGLLASRQPKLYPDGGSSLIFIPTHSGLTVRYSLETETFSADAPNFHNAFGFRFRPGAAFDLLKLRPEDSGRPSIDLLTQLPTELVDAVAKIIESSAAFSLTTLDSAISSAVCAQQPGELLSKLAPALIQRPNSSATLAELVAKSRRSLERQIRQQVGVSPGDLLKYQRLQWARRQLMDASLSIAEIALDCGYCDQPHFSHAFKEFAQETPAAYRERKLAQIYNR